MFFFTCHFETPIGMEAHDKPFGVLLTTQAATKCHETILTHLFGDARVKT